MTNNCNKIKTEQEAVQMCCLTRTERIGEKKGEKKENMPIARRGVCDFAYECLRSIRQPKNPIKS